LFFFIVDRVRKNASNRIFRTAIASPDSDEPTVDEGQFESGGCARRGWGGSGRRARRVRFVAGAAGDASEASGSAARVLDADASPRASFSPARQAKPCRRRFRERDRYAGAIDAGNARASLGWGTYVVDVRDDGHVADVVLLVHLTTELVDRELRREGERGRSG
jgi:hypothetical protein